jgi:cysteine-rich repeat protein
MTRRSTLGVSLLLLAAGAAPVHSGKVYWGDWDDSLQQGIERASTDGSGWRETIIEDAGRPTGVALDLAAGHLYWISDEDEYIRRATLDGWNVQDVNHTGMLFSRDLALDLVARRIYYVGVEDWNFHGVIRWRDMDRWDIVTVVDLPDTSPAGIALDVQGGKMYWTDQAQGEVRRADLDGTGLETLVSGLDLPVGIALDVAAGKVYWTQSGMNANAWPRLQRADLDGTNVENLLATPVRPFGLAIDVLHGKLYWTDLASKTLERSNLDGTAVETLVDGLDSPRRLALAIGGVCGNGTVDPFEDCDDGNTAAGDACTSDCTLAPKDVPALSVAGLLAAAAAILSVTALVRRR